MSVNFEYWKDNLVKISAGKNVSEIFRKLGVPFHCKKYRYITHFKNIRKIEKELNKNGVNCTFNVSLLDEFKKYEAYVNSKKKSLIAYIKKVDDKLKEDGKSLFEHQKIGIEFLALNNGAILGDDLGLGKTLQAIFAAPPKAPILIVAPVNAKFVWKNEIKKWLGREAEVLSGRKSFRAPEAGEILITNYEILPRELLAGKTPTKIKPGVKNAFTLEDIQKKVKILNSVKEFTVLIADEGHRLKNKKAQRTKKFKTLAKDIQSKGGKVWILTATPQTNNGKDVWSLLDCIDAKEYTFGDWMNFTKLYDADIKGLEWGTPSKDVKFYLKNSLLRRTKDQVLDLPPVINEIVPVEVEEQYMLACDNFLKECEKLGISFEEAYEIASDINSEMSRHIMTIKSALALSKLPGVISLIEDYEAAEEPVLVGCTHLDPLEVIGKRKGWAIIKGGISADQRNEICNDFQSGRYKGLALSALAASESLTLHRACHMILMDRWWGPTVNNQLKGRIHRTGQKRTCYYKELVIDHPIEYKIFEMNRKKQEQIDLTIEGVSEI